MIGSGPSQYFLVEHAGESRHVEGSLFLERSCRSICQVFESYTDVIPFQSQHHLSCTFDPLETHTPLSKSSYHLLLGPIDTLQSSIHH